MLEFHVDDTVADDKEDTLVGEKLARVFQLRHGYDISTYTQKLRITSSLTWQSAAVDSDCTPIAQQDVASKGCH